jgi:hypothetical protein
VAEVDWSPNRLVGAWRLIAWETRSDDGQIDYPFGRDATGLLIYTDSGHMSVSIASAGREPFAAGDLLGGAVAEKARAMETYISYCGRYERRGESVIHHVELSLFPNWAGHEQERRVSFDADRLALEAPPLMINGAEQRARLLWERL